MSSAFLRRTVFAGVAAVTLALSGLPAQAAPPAEPPSTDVPFTTIEGHMMSYVLNTDNARPEGIDQAEEVVRVAGGTVVQSWPQIGVVVAHSARADFLARVRGANSPSIQSIGPTRTAPVTEGTPGAAGLPDRVGSGSEDTWELTGRAVPAPVSPAPPGPGDPLEPQQWDMQMVKADQAHAVTLGSPDVLVGVLDSGIDPDHPDLKPNLDVANSVNCSIAGQPDRTEFAWQNTTNPHGTHVAGTIAAARNGVGMVGVAPGVRIASVKVVSDGGFIYPEYAICGFVWAADRGMDVTNNSYFVDPFEFWCADQADQAPAMEAVRRAVAYSTGKGVVHAAAAGNSNYDLADKSVDAGSPNDSPPVQRRLNSNCRNIPTELPGVVTVSAVTRAGVKAQLSNYGTGEIDVAAPGQDILSTMPTDDPVTPNYALLSGTSMAAPHVAGVLALLRSGHPDASPDQLIAMLRAQADDVACPLDYPPTPGQPTPQICRGSAAYNSFYGDGMADALDAVSSQH